ncbi:MAG TPA: DUF1778 domain-containing protein [Burkholderiaceae bacterium]|nr:DUF1778 domain-containing protein [Burkholderiaceae bacterium]
MNRLGDGNSHLGRDANWKIRRTPLERRCLSRRCDQEVLCRGGTSYPGSRQAIPHRWWQIVTIIVYDGKVPYAAPSRDSKGPSNPDFLPESDTDMANKIEERGRITARAPQPVVDQLEEAAALVGVTVNQFIVQAATEKARTIIDAHTRIELSRRDAAFIAKLLDDPPVPNAALKRAAQRYKKVIGHGNPPAAKPSRH